MMGWDGYIQVVGGIEHQRVGFQNYEFYPKEGWAGLTQSKRIKS